MPLSRLENFLRSVRGNIIYVDPNSLDSTDSIENDGTSAARPFKTLQRALIESSRFSYLPGKDNDKFANTTVLLYPGEHLIDNRPGWIPLSASSFLKRDGTISSDFTEFNLQTNFDITTDNNILYKFNSIHGGVIVPRGTSIVGYDLRKTKIRPKYVPNPENDNIERSAIFRLTGGCYIWQMTIFDANPNGQCFKDYTTNKFVPNFSHHKLTTFEYADGVNSIKINDAFIGDFPSSVRPPYLTTRTDLDIYYEKIGLAYGDSSGRRILPNYPDEVDIESKIDEYRIVGSRGAEVGISSVISGDGITPTTEITVTLQESLEGLDVDTPIKISGVSESGYNGQYVVNRVISDTQILYNVSNPPSIPIGGSGGTLSIVVDNVTSSSPYIFNCSLKSVYGLCGIHADGSVVTGFKSLVVAQFTGISLQKDNNAFVKYDEITDSYVDSSNVISIYSDSLARYKPSYETYHIKASNDAFIQAVSIFAIGYASHFLGESGGDLSITNSNSNFGAKSLVSKGFRSDKFIRDDIGYISHIIPPKQIENKPISLEFYSIDAQTTRNEGDSKKLYLYNAGDETSPPINTIEGYRIGAKIDDKIYISNQGVEYSANILMNGNGSNSYQKEYQVNKQNNINSILDNKINLTENHNLFNGESIRVYSDIGELPNGIDLNTIYYAITDEIDLTLTSNQIRLAASLNDAKNAIPITIYNTTTSDLNIISRVSDKKSGDPGHPIQYDTSNNKWYITSNFGNSIYTFISSSSINVSSRSYIKRILDNRNSENSIYKFRYVIPKDSLIKGRPPVEGFILQESTSIPSSSTEILKKYSSDGLLTEINNPEQLRNTRFISNASYLNGVVTIETEEPHHLTLGNTVEILNVFSSNNLLGLPNSGFNGTYKIVNLPSRRKFSYNVSGNPGSFIDSTSDRTLSLPYYNRKKLSTTCVTYQSEQIQEYIHNQQDGIYYLKVINSSNYPKVSPFNGYNFLQPIKNLYPQRDRDNLISDPISSNSFALSDPIGQVIINNPEKSLTKETLEHFLSDYRVGFGITDIVSNGNDSYSIYTDIDHGLNPISSLSIVNSGSNYGSNIGNETLYNADLIGGSGEGASALIRINSSGQIQSLELINGGSGYSVGNLLTVTGVATTTGHVAGTVIVDDIYDHTTETVSISGISSEKYSEYNTLYRITSVVNSRKINCIPSTPILLQLNNGFGNIDYQKIYGHLTGKSILCSSVSYNSNTQTGTIVLPESHGLNVNDKFRLSGASNSFFNNEFIVSKVNNLTSISFYVGDSTSQTTSGNIRLYRIGMSSKGGDNIRSDEGRLITQYYGVTSSTTGVIDDVGDELSISNLSSLGLKIGDYLQIDNEIIRIKETVTTNPIKVFRGLLGTSNSQHPSGSIVRKIYAYPIEFRRHSILRASGHTFEYVGFGPGNYSNAFPERQDRQITKEEELLSQSFKIDGGINIYTGMNNDGDFYIGNKIINSSTGDENVFDSPIPLIRGEDDLENNNLINFTNFNKINITSSLRVDGGKNKDNITEFNGPVIFNNKIVSNSDRGIEVNSLYIQGNETVSRMYTVGNSEPISAGTPGDVEYYSQPEDGGYLGWVYTKNNSWRKFGLIQNSNNKWSNDSSFIDLSDTPGTYGSNAGKVVVVNSNNDGLEFVNPTTVGTDTDNYVDNVSFSNGTLTLERTGSLIDLTTTIFIPTDISDLNDNNNVIPTKTSDLTNDSGFITTDNDNYVDNVSFSNGTLTLERTGSLSDLTTTIFIPTKTSDLDNDSGFITTDNDNYVDNVSFSNGTLTLGRTGSLSDLTTTITPIKIKTVTRSTIADHYLTFVDSDNSSAEDEFLYTNNGIKFNPGNGDLNVSGSITATGEIKSSSDIKLKTNIKTLSDSLDKVLNMRGVEYDRIDMDNKHQIGVIAQEVEEIVPELVSDNDGTKTVSYGNITALLIEAIKEQQEHINTLEEKLKKIEQV